MTAFDFIEQIYSRPQTGVESNTRRITRAQLYLLRTLIGENEEGGALQAGIGDSFVWMPAGRNKYVITEDARGNRHTIARLSNLRASGTGRLF